MRLFSLRPKTRDTSWRSRLGPWRSKTRYTLLCPMYKAKAAGPRLRVGLQPRSPLLLETMPHQRDFPAYAGLSAQGRKRNPLPVQFHLLPRSPIESATPRIRRLLAAHLTICNLCPGIAQPGSVGAPGSVVVAYSAFLRPLTHSTTPPHLQFPNCPHNAPPPTEFPHTSH